MPETIENTEPKALPPPQRRFTFSRSALGATALVGVLIAGAALGAGGTRLAQRWTPQSVMMLQPAAINQLKDASMVAVKGEVTEIFGNKLVLQDNSGRALIDTGPRGEDRNVATKGETLTVQGRFDRGVIHAEVVMHADGRADAFGPPHGPKDGPKDGPKGPKGGPKDGPRADRGSPPPPPPGDRPDPEDAPPPPR